MTGEAADAIGRRGADVGPVAPSNSACIGQMLVVATVVGESGWADSVVPLWEAVDRFNKVAAPGPSRPSRTALLVLFAYDGSAPLLAPCLLGL